MFRSLLHLFVPLTMSVCSPSNLVWPLKQGKNTLLKNNMKSHDLNIRQNWAQKITMAATVFHLVSKDSDTFNHEGTQTLNLLMRSHTPYPLGILFSSFWSPIGKAAWLNKRKSIIRPRSWRGVLKRVQDWTTFGWCEHLTHLDVSGIKAHTLGVISSMS